MGRPLKTRRIARLHSPASCSNLSFKFNLRAATISLMFALPLGKRLNAWGLKEREAPVFKAGPFSFVLAPVRRLYAPPFTSTKTHLEY
jgi:hypothetical protein